MISNDARGIIDDSWLNGDDTGSFVDDTISNEDDTGSDTRLTDDDTSYKIVQLIVGH